MSEPAASPAGLRWVNLGRLEKVPLGQGFPFRIGALDIAVFRQRDGSLFATESRCPHKNGPLSDGLVGGGSVICPLHTKKFDLASGRGPDPSLCLKTYPVRQVQGEILLGLETGVECAPAA
ncbi:MAG TPA: Rieske 2Fe-2S domain-containing protein [Planctomycetota bacterium]|nr:Rieske 2Fe-2S domain-containing protein [Planctomycetota bacterium]